MKFEFEEIKTRKVDISKDEAEKLILDYIKEYYEIDPYMWIEDGNLMHQVEYHTSHAWYDNEIKRKASKEDKTLLKMSKIISKNLSKKDRNA